MKKNNNKEFKKIENDVKKMEKALEGMKKNKGISADAIMVQEQVLNEKRIQMDELKKKTEAEQDGSYKDEFLTFSVVDEETHMETEKQYKVAFVKNNRPINKKTVDGFITIIANNKYVQAYPIIATPAIDAIANGYQVRNVKGECVTEENAEEYIVILDGQHRTLAYIKCNITETRIVPNVHIKKIKELGQFLVDINDVGASWSHQDRFAVAGLVSDDELIQNIANRIDEGFSPSTASLIYIGKKITGTQVKKLLRGEKWTLPEGAKTDIERGNRFIQLCIEANISKKFVKKRFFINAFNSYALSVGDEVAFDNLSKLKTRNLTDDILKTIKDDQEFIKMLNVA